MPRQSFPRSTALASADYDPERLTLTIDFRGGGSCTHHSVPPDVFEQLAQADSPGRFWHASIKDQYP